MVFYKKGKFYVLFQSFLPYNPLTVGKNTVLRIRIPNTDPEGLIEYGSGRIRIRNTGAESEPIFFLYDQVPYFTKIRTHFQLHFSLEVRNYPFLAAPASFFLGRLRLQRAAVAPT